MPNGLQPSPTQPRVPPEQKQPEIMTVTFKKVKGSMGLSIVAAMVSGFFYAVPEIDNRYAI